ncbi:MAG: T9SS type A sorting domain-containing protein [bacterium]
MALLKLDTVSVGNELIMDLESLLYKNNQFEYVSNKAFIGESIIYDLTGKTIMNLGIQNFIVGKNYIRVNQNLPLGIYILSIKSGTEQFSYKFLVE